MIRYGPFKDYIADAVRVGELLYLSGQVSIDDDGNVVAPGDIVAQARQCYARIEEILERAGATMDDLVDETVFVTDMASAMGNIDALFTARAEAYRRNPEVTQTMVQAAGLVMPELLIEIKCVARL